MASGLTCVVPAIGGSTEFVPQKYQYHSIPEATEIVTKILVANKTNKVSKTLESLNTSNRASTIQIHIW